MFIFNFSIGNQFISLKTKIFLIHFNLNLDLLKETKKKIVESEAKYQFELIHFKLFHFVCNELLDEQK